MDGNILERHPTLKGIADKIEAIILLIALLLYVIFKFLIRTATYTFLGVCIAFAIYVTALLVTHKPLPWWG